MQIKATTTPPLPLPDPAAIAAKIATGGAGAAPANEGIQPGKRPEKAVDLSVPPKLRDELRALQREQRQLGKLLGSAREMGERMESLRSVLSEMSGVVRDVRRNPDDLEVRQAAQARFEALQGALEDIEKETRLPGKLAGRRALAVAGELRMSAQAVGVLSAFTGPAALRDILFDDLQSESVRLVRDGASSAPATSPREIDRLIGQARLRSSVMADLFEETESRIESRLAQIGVEIAHLETAASELPDAEEAERLAVLTATGIREADRPALQLHANLPSVASLARLLE